MLPQKRKILFLKPIDKLNVHQNFKKKKVSSIAMNENFHSCHCKNITNGILEKA